MKWNVAGRSLTVVLSIVSLILGIIAICGSRSTSSLTSIYQIKLDMSLLNRNNSFLSGTEYEKLTLEELGISEIYTVGTDSFCRGDESGMKSCETDFFPDIRLMIFKDIKRFGNGKAKTISYINVNFPKTLPKFDRSPWNSTRKAIHYCLIVAIAFNGVSLLAFVLECFWLKHIWASSISLFFCFVSWLLYLTTAASSIHLFKKSADSLGSKAFGATLGNSAFHLLVWFAFALSFTSFLICIISQCRLNKTISLPFTSIWRLIKYGPISPPDPEQNSQRNIRKSDQQVPKNQKFIDLDKNMKELQEKLEKLQQEEWEKASNHHDEEVEEKTSDNSKANESESECSKSFVNGSLNGVDTKKVGNIVS